MTRGTKRGCGGTVGGEGRAAVGGGAVSGGGSRGDGTLMISGGSYDKRGVGMHGGGTIIEGAGGSVKGTTLAETGFVIGGCARATPAGKRPATGHGGKGIGTAGCSVEKGCSNGALV